MTAFRIGDEVLAPWLDDGFVYPAVVVELKPAGLHVAYLDGDEADVPSGAVLPGVFGPGVTVSVNWKGRRTYYAGVIAQRVGAALFVHFDDGAREWTTVAQGRVRADAAASLRPSEVVCDFCGARRPDVEPACGQCGAQRRG